jgi:hypothetical protein
MPATSEKKRSVEEPAVPAERAELAGAIDRRRQCVAGVTAKLEAIARARAGEDTARAEIEKCKAAVPKARETDARSAATNRDNDKAPSTAWHLSSAISNVERAERELEVAIAARELLESDLVDLEIDAAMAANAVIVVRAQLLAPLIASTMARVRAARLQILKDRVLLSTLLADKDAPQFPDDARAFFPSREAEQARVKAIQTACGEMRAEAAADGAYLAQMPTANSIEDYSLAMEVAAQWTHKLSRLLDDPIAELPEKT